MRAIKGTDSPFLRNIVCYAASMLTGFRTAANVDRTPLAVNRRHCVAIGRVILRNDLETIYSQRAVRVLPLKKNSLNV